MLYSKLLLFPFVASICVLLSGSLAYADIGNAHFLREQAPPGTRMFMDAMHIEESAEGLSEHVAALALDVIIGGAPGFAEAVGESADAAQVILARALALTGPYQHRESATDALATWQEPVRTYVERAPFGPRRRTTSFTEMRHTGVSYLVTGPVGVQSVARGVVIFAGQIDGLGGVVVVDHGEAIVSVYGNLLDVQVQRWQPVNAGSPVGLGGATSTFALPEVYFELRQAGIPVDPAPWFSPEASAAL